MQFIRELREGMSGPDVEAAKRAVYRALGASYSWKQMMAGSASTRRKYTKFMRQHVQDFQRLNRLHVDGVIGPETLERLSRAKRKGTQEPAFDAYARRLWRQAVDLYLGDMLVRQRIVKEAARLTGENARIWYSQARPMLYRPAPTVPSYLDCSGFATHCYRAAGAPDPNGYQPGYPGWGFTGTLWYTGRAISMVQLKPGDLVFYGRPWLAGGAAHVVVYKGGGQVYSMGSSAGPKVEPVNYRPVVGCRTYRLR